MRSRWVVTSLACLFVVLILPSPAQAYIGPGAGFALAGSVFAVFAAVLSAVAMLLTWPLRWIFRLFFGSQAMSKAAVQRAVVIGLDGMDWSLTERLLSEGKLPNLARLRANGTCRPLKSTVPPVSEVAWTTFQTGMNPGKHGVFDARVPSPTDYHAEASTLRVNGLAQSNGARGWLPLPLAAAKLGTRRRGVPFWELLGRKAIFSAVLRVPHSTVPVQQANRFRGVMLSGALDPDEWLDAGKGTLFTTQSTHNVPAALNVQAITREGNRVRSRLVLHQHPQWHDAAQPLELPIEFKVLSDDRVLLSVSGEKHVLRKDQFSDWIAVTFQPGLGKTLPGVCRFLLLEAKADLRVYVTPIHLDPDGPAVVNSAPKKYGQYLAKRFGAFAGYTSTADVRSARANVLDEKHLLRLLIDDDTTRADMFLDLLGKVRRGLCLVVLEGIDAMHRSRRQAGSRGDARFTYDVATLEEGYRRADEFIGKVLDRCTSDDLLIVFSSHGQAQARHDVDLNRWLEDAGYLVCHPGRRCERNLAGVDWAQTRAFASGSGSIYCNSKRRFAAGTVTDQELNVLRQEVTDKLLSLRCAAGEPVVQRVYDCRRVFWGPRRDDAPDLLVAFADGFRAGDQTAEGAISEHLFTPTAGVHAMNAAWDRDLAPGVLFCNRELVSHVNGQHEVRLADLAPTLLKQFGVAVPPELDGVAWELALQEIDKP
ncbi:MAG: alkaline phosphatase family protein [Planctomycetales bacterium]|nr:alkaline phosphatase family protein [Planctomycetales bacterium]